MGKAFSVASVLKIGTGFSLVFLIVSAVSAQDAPPPPPASGTTYTSGAFVPALSVDKPFESVGLESEDLHHGQLNINIPLHTLKSNNISAPVSISYNTGGIKVAEVASRVGLGWQLSAGGQIEREIRGRSDGANDGSGFNIGVFVNNSIASDPTKFNTLSSTNQGLFCYNAYDKSLDTEPDIYHFNFGGYSGKIVFDANKIPHIISKQNIKVVVDFNSTTKDVQSWTLTTDDGVKYTFATIETINYHTLIPKTTNTPADPGGYGPYGNGYVVLGGYGATTTSTTFVRTYLPSTETAVKWYLDLITSPTGNNVITFTYDAAGPIYYNSEAEISVSPYISKGLASQFIGSFPDVDKGRSIPAYDPSRQAFQTTINRILPKRISKISSLSSVVIFNYEADERYDLQGDHALLSISVKSNDVAVLSATKTFNFAYSYFYANYSFAVKPNSSIYDYRRLQLISLTEVGNGVSKPPYTFSYNQTYKLPGRCDLKYTDHWGYYNNAPITSNDDFIPATQYTNPLYSAQGISNFEGVNRTSAVPVSGVSPMMANVLEMIVYPAGGSAVLDYEGNTYYNSATNTNDYVGGLRIKKLLKYNGETTTSPIVRNYTYTLQENSARSSGSIDALPKYHYEKIYTNGTITTTGPYKFYHYLVGSPVPIVEIGMTNGNHVGYSCVTVSEPGKGSTVYKFTSFTDQPDIVNTSTIGTFSASGTTGTVISNPSPVVTQSPASIYLPSTSMEMERGLLLSVAVYDNNGIIQKKTSNTYNFDDYDQKIIYGLRTNSSGFYKGFAQAASVCFSSGGTTSNNISCYMDFIRATTGITYDYYYSVTPISGVTWGDGYWGFYSHISKRVSLLNTTEEVYDQVSTSTKFPASSNVITNTSTYSYVDPATYGIYNYTQGQFSESSSPVVANPAQTFRNYNYQLKSSTTTTSDGRVITTSYTYPRDYANNAGTGNSTQNVGITYLQNTNQNSVIIETLIKQTLADGSTSILSGEINDFYPNGLLRTKSLLEIQTPLNTNSFNYSVRANQGYSIYTPDLRYKLRLTFDAYDAADNVTQTTQVNDLPNAVVWGQNKSYVVAQASNVKSSQIAYSSFELPYAVGNFNISDGNLSFKNTTVDLGRSGGFSINSPVNTNALPAGNYKIGFWAKFIQIYPGTNYNVVISVNNVFLKNVSINALQTVNDWTYFETTVSLSANQWLTISPAPNMDQLLLDDVSVCPVGVMMSTYVYKPLVGVMVETDPNRVSTYYEYDELNRLKLVRDQDKNIRSKTTYNYKQ